MKLLIGIPLWILYALVRIIFIVIGWFFIPLTLVADGGYRTPPLWRPVYGNVEDIPAKAKRNRWTKYVEMAWRNPTGGEVWRVDRGPIPKEAANLDHMVRVAGFKSASRWLVIGVLWEYWHMRQIDWTVPEWVPKFGGKHYKWFEIRVGWKLVDSKEYATPTLQLGPRSS